MNIVPWNNKDKWLDSFGDMENLQRQLNKVFGTTLARPLRAASGESYWAPPVDIYDEKDCILIKADIPGLTKEQIDISVENNVMTIKGEKNEEKEYKEESRIRLERSQGKFLRSFTIPTGINLKNVSANFKNGVLELRLPKEEEVKVKQIKVDIQ